MRQVGYIYCMYNILGAFQHCTFQLHRYLVTYVLLFPKQTWDPNCFGFYKNLNLLYTVGDGKV